MKKLLMALLASGLLMGCSASNYDVKVSDADSVLATSGDLKITKQDFFEYLLDSSGANTVLKDALNTIADKEITDQKQIDALLKEKEKTYAEYADGDLTKYAKYLGYDSKEAYIKEALTAEVKQELLRNKYIDENLKDLIKTYQVSSFKKIIVDKESTALALIKESTSAEIFDKKMTENKSKSEDAGIVTNQTSLDENLKKELDKLSAMTKDGVYSQAIKLSDNTYAVIYVYNTDHKNTTELAKKLSSLDDVIITIDASYLKKYNFKVNDNKVTEAIKKISDQYIG